MLCIGYTRRLELAFDCTAARQGDQAALHSVPIEGAVGPLEAFVTAEMLRASLARLVEEGSAAAKGVQCDLQRRVASRPLSR